VYKDDLSVYCKFAEYWYKYKMYSLIYSFEFYQDGNERGFKYRIGAYNEDCKETIGFEEEFSYKNSALM